MTHPDLFGTWPGNFLSDERFCLLDAGSAVSQSRPRGMRDGFVSKQFGAVG